MQERVLKITFWRQLNMLSHIFIVSAGVLLGVYWKLGYIPKEGSVYVFGFLFLFDFLPAIALHIQYLLKNKGLVVVVNGLKKSITIIKKGFYEEYNIADIKCLTKVASYGGGTGFYSFGEYRYYKLEFNDNTVFYITCLMAVRIEGKFTRLLDIKAISTFKLLATISGHSIPR
jgi:hypothetical protein